MKKIIAVCAFVLTFSVIFAGEYINTMWSLGTSAIFYGDPDVKKVNYNLKKQDYLNLVLTGEYGVQFQLDEKIDFIILGYLTLDDYSSKKSVLLRLDYGVSGGVRLRPGFGGVTLGCEYCTGQRADIDSLGSGKPQGSVTQWGNGYRLMFEYDFSAHVSGIAPVIGMSFKSIPRGNNFRDGNLAFYFRLLS